MEQFFEKIVAPVLKQLPIKIVAMLIVVGLIAMNIYGALNLEQENDLLIYIPSDSYAYDFSMAQREYFPSKGSLSAAYFGKLPKKVNVILL